MRPPPGPTEDEEERVAALLALELLDSEAELQFDSITRLAAEITGLPIALVSLVDESRQWFKSKVGLAVSETPREHAFCAHAIHGRNVFVVEDTVSDPRFAENPLVTGEPNIRFYAGAPLVTKNGHSLGTLCVIGDSPRTFSEREAQVLKNLAEHVMNLIEYRSMSRNLAATVSKLKIISGLVPVCAWCKQVRDDKGMWHDVDCYIAQHTKADVTHGMCPTCSSATPSDDSGNFQR